MDDQRIDFGFPFEPYDVQVSFANALRDALQESKIGIFESPTGTGKSLSLICGTLTWFAELKATRKSTLASEIAQLTRHVDAPVGADWVLECSRRIQQKNRLHDLRRQYDRILERENKFQDLKRDAEKNVKPPRKEVTIEDELSTVRQIIAELSDTVDELLEDYDSGDGGDDSSDDDDGEYEAKIIYCSRTHTQLSQFVKELKRTRHSGNIRSVCLGSRQSMCIYDPVKKLSSLSLINEKCLDMQKKKKVLTNSPESKRKKCSQNGCPFYKQHAMEACSDRILTETRDIEDIVQTGKEMNACPYYSARYAVSEAELVVVPYNILFQVSARKACNLNLKGSVIIIDEAHNLLETINGTYSVEMNGRSLVQAHALLGSYLSKYMSRLNVKNVKYIKQILHILKVFISHVGALRNGVTVAYCLTELFSDLHLEEFNLFKILRYFQHSRIALRVRTFGSTAYVDSQQSAFEHFLASPRGSKLERPQESMDGRSASGAPLILVQEFFRALTNAHSDGRVLCHGTGEPSTSFMKYVQLNPAAHFKDIVSEARAIILAGGTMQPTDEFVHQLLIPAGMEEGRVTYFSCGHVVPKTNLLASVICRGPTSRRLELNYRSREDPEVIEEVGRVLANVCRIIPSGVVCFFPSYEYQMFVQDKWNKSGMLEKLGARKRIFCEPRKASQVDKVLNEYARCIQSTKGSSTGINGALLFSVVNGKMSEGINFSDDMGRGVIMVGMPYANLRSPELEEKIAFLSKMYPRAPDGRPAGQVYYENTCIKAVNQSIGRAIRHKADYATILFLDHRYRRQAVTKALPLWIGDSLRQHETFGPAFAEIRNFFASRK